MKIILSSFLATSLLQVFVLTNITFAQEALRFKSEVDELSKQTVVQDSIPTYILFTGSASIRLWKDLPNIFPDKKIINTGFGGSQLSDLLYFSQRLILNYKPKQIFIYEGDNDLEARGCPGTIVKNAKTLVAIIKKALPQAEIVFISIKPCPARWEQRAEEREFNFLLSEYAKQTPNVKFIDVWTKMIDKDGGPRKELFLENGLHMNKLGYEIWTEEIKKVIK